MVYISLFANSNFVPETIKFLPRHSPTSSFFLNFISISMTEFSTSVGVPTCCIIVGVDTVDCFDTILFWDFFTLVDLRLQQAVTTLVDLHLLQAVTTLVDLHLLHFCDSSFCVSALSILQSSGRFSPSTSRS